MLRSGWLSYKGGRLLRSEKYSDALPYLLKAYQVKKNFSNAFSLAECYYYNKIYDKALDIFLDLEKQNPENPDTLGYIGACLFNTGHDIEAKNYLERAIELFQKFPEVLYILGKIALRQNDRVSALNYYRQAVELDPVGMFRLYEKYKKHVLGLN